jgi:hypothetical protein
VLRAKMTESPGPRIAKRLIQDAAAEAAKKTAEYWHEKYLPGHFTVEGGKKYGYQPRKGDDQAPYLLRPVGSMGFARRVRNNAYSWRKRRMFGHNKPLVFTGASEQAAKQQVRLSTRFQRSTGTVVATAAMNLPTYFYQYRKDYNAPDKVAELLRVTTDEETDLQVFYQTQLSELLSNVRKFPEIRRIR